MAVTTSSGNGYALYNGAKLPNVDSVWTDIIKYPYALTVGDMQFGMVLFSSEPLVHSNGLVSNDVVLSVAYYLVAEDGSWELLVESDDVPIGEVTADGVGWTSHDILNTDNTVYLAASDPIPLDGMTIIEWDGDTTGLEVTDFHCKVSDDVLTMEQMTSSVVCFLEGSALSVVKLSPETIFDSPDEGWRGTDVVLSAYNTATYPSVGLYFLNYDPVGRTTLFAYPASGESEPTYDRTAFLSGMAMGLIGKGDPTFEGSDTFSKGYKTGAALRRKRRLPVAYLYNGVRLPNIYSLYTPELQKTHPFVWVSTESKWHFIHLSTQMPCVNADGKLFFPNGAEVRNYDIGVDWQEGDDFGWSINQTYEAGGVYVSAKWTFWANADILNEDGSVYIYASEPVPVYE